MFIDDFVESVYRLTQSDHGDPVNLGSDRADQRERLVDLVAEIPARPSSSGTIRRSLKRTRPQQRQHEVADDPGVGALHLIA